jgi:hypothetical protein
VIEIIKTLGMLAVAGFEALEHAAVMIGRD